ncbi:MAG: Sec-independent protein translocase protein TatB [Gammaproteobacteria bacterium]
MFDVGFWEISLIAIVALVVVGPERLPSLVNEAGKWAGRARATARDLKYDLQRQAEFDELAKLGNEFKESADDVNPNKIRTNLRDMLDDLEKRSEPLDDEDDEFDAADQAGSGDPSEASIAQAENNADNEPPPQKPS